MSRFAISSRFLAPLALLTALQSGCGGCGGCSEDTAETDVSVPVDPLLEPATLPESPLEVSTALVSRAPATAEAVVLVRSLPELLAGWPAIRARGSVLLGEFGQLEAEVRNTFGFDPERPASLEELGIAGNGAAMWVPVDERDTFFVFLSNPTLFLERATAVLQAQPFNFRAAIEQRDTGGSRVLLFREEEGASPGFVVVVHRGVGILYQPDTDHDPLDDIAVLTGVAPGSSFADIPEVRPALEDIADYPIAAFLSLPNAVAAERARVEQAYEGSEIPRHLQESLDVATTTMEFGTLALGLKLSGERIELRALSRPGEVFANSIHRVIGSVSNNPDFPRLLSEDTWAFARGTFNPGVFITEVRNHGTPMQREMLQTGLDMWRQASGTDFEADISPALGSHLYIGVTRARILSLNSFLSQREHRLSDLFNGLGLVVALSVTDRPRLDAALAAAIPALGGHATLFTESGATVVQFTDQESDIGNIILTDDLLLLVPDRQRGEVIARLSANPSSLEALREPGARDLLTSDIAQGLYVDGASVLGGPLGAFLLSRLPESGRPALQMIDEIFLLGSTNGPALYVDTSVTFVAVPAPAP